jgi:SAM-dependent methyltransferase
VADIDLDGPQYADHFRVGSVWDLMRGVNAYDLAGTYELTRGVFGYGLHYVNYGRWTAGQATAEPGRELTLYLGEVLGLKDGDRLLEGGSGLGQAAADLAQHYKLARVLGMNPCAPQAGFANALAAHAGLDARVKHEIVDACAHVDTLAPGSFDHGMAQECIGHFPDPERFLKGVHQALRPGGRFAFTRVSAPTPPGRTLAAFQKFFFGVVPVNTDQWVVRMRDAGFVNVESRDMTAEVFPPLFERCRNRLRDEPGSMGWAGPISRRALLAFLNQCEAGVRDGRMGYEVVWGEKAA